MQFIPVWAQSSHHIELVLLPSTVQDSESTKGSSSQSLPSYKHSASYLKLETNENPTVPF